MQFKIGQQMITIMFNIFVQHIINFFRYHPPCGQIIFPHAHIIIYCNKLNSGCCLSIDSVNVNKS